MLDPNLKSACNAIYDWCERTSTAYDIVYDEDDTQGVLIFRRDGHKVRPLLNAVRESLNGLYVRQIRGRAGTIVLMSTQAITEKTTASLGATIVTDEFALKVTKIFDGELTAESETAQPTVKERLAAAAKEMRESQYKTPTNVLKRTGSLSSFKNSIVRGHGDGEKPDAGATEGDESAETATAEDEAKLEYTHRLSDILSELAPPGGAQGLQGLGAENQPGDLFKRFAQAMQALGAQLNLGAPLQDLLKRQGISWKKSEDAQAVIFFVKNAATNAPQPIARVGYQTLGKPQDFQSQLMNMLDFAKGQAPGTEQQRYEEAQEAQKQMRELANQYAPPQQGQGGGSQQQAPSMIAPQPAASAPASAAPEQGQPQPNKSQAKPQPKPSPPAAQGTQPQRKPGMA